MEGTDVLDGTLATPKMKIWINNVLEIDEDTTLTALFNSNVEWLIGALFLGSSPNTYQNHYGGLLDEAYLYPGRSFTNSDVDDIFALGEPVNNEALPSAADMLSGFRMGDDFTGGIQPDLKGVNPMTGINMNNGDKSTDVPVGV